MEIPAQNIEHPVVKPDPSARWKAWLVILVIGILTAISFWLRVEEIGFIPGPTGIYPIDFVFWMVLVPLAPPVYALIAALILMRQPKNLVAWMFVGLSSLILIEDISWQYAQRALSETSNGLPFGLAVGWINNIAEMISVPPVFLGLAFLYFPNGKLPGRWAQFIAAAGVASMGLITFGAIVEPELDVAWPLLYPNPTHVAWLAPASPFLEQAGLIIGIGVILLAMLSIILRWRSSTGIIRQQIKWLAYVCGLVIVSFFGLLMAFPPADQDFNLLAAFLLLAFTALITTGLPAAIGIAILRYRLWNIDRIIRRTLAYSLVTILLGLVYSGSVVLLQQLFRVLTGEDSNLSIVFSTLAIVALFNPLNGRVQTVIDRRFYRGRYDAMRTLSTFSESLRNEINLDALSSRLTEVVDVSMHPRQVGVWLKPAPGSRPRRWDEPR